MSRTKELIMRYEEADTADRETLVRTYPEFFGIKPTPKRVVSNPDIDLLQPKAAPTPKRVRMLEGESTPVPEGSVQMCNPSEIIKGDIVKLDGKWHRVVRIDKGNIIIINTAHGLDVYPVSATTRFIPYLSFSLS